jgi:hypothetical protein
MQVISYDQSEVGEGPFLYSFSDVPPGSCYTGAFTDSNDNGIVSFIKIWIVTDSPYLLQQGHGSVSYKSPDLLTGVNQRE